MHIASEAFPRGEVLDLENFVAHSVPQSTTQAAVELLPFFTTSIIIITASSLAGSAAWHLIFSR